MANSEEDDPRLPVAKPDPEFASSIRSQLKIPAIGLLIAGLVNLLATLVILLIPVVVERSGGLDDGAGFVEGASTFAEAMFVSIMIALCSFAAVVFLVLGAARMFDLQSYSITVWAAVVAILPIAIGLPISLPLGIWALIVLLREDVKHEFEGGRR